MFDSNSKQGNSKTTFIMGSMSTKLDQKRSYREGKILKECTITEKKKHVKAELKYKNQSRKII